MLRPLDALDVDSFFGHLPKGAHIAQTAHFLADEADGVVNLLLGGKPAKADAKGGVRHVFLNSDGSEHVRRL